MAWFDDSRIKDPSLLNYKTFAQEAKQGLETATSQARQRAIQEHQQQEIAQVYEARALGRMLGNRKMKKMLSDRNVQVWMQQQQQAERQAEWDAQAKQGEMWRKLRESAITKLADDLDFYQDPTERERAIVAKTYELAALEYQKSEQWDLAAEFKRRAEIAGGFQQPTEQDYASGLIKQNVAGVPPTEGEMGKPEKFVRKAGEVLKTAGEGLLRHTFEDWSIMVNIAQMLAKKGELDENEQAFLDAIHKSSAEFQAKQGPEDVMMHEAPEVSDEVYEAYNNLGLGRQIAGEVTYPLAWLPILQGGAMGARASIGARTAVGTGALDKALVEFSKGTARLALLPLEGIERLIAAPFKAAGKAISKSQASKLAAKAKANPEKIEGVLQKVARQEPLGADDIAKAQQFDDDLGKVIAEAVPEPKPVAATELGATGGIAEKPIIGGGEAYDPIRDILNFGDVDKTVAKLYPQSNEGAVMRLIGKIPGVGPDIVRRIDPSKTPRATIEARAVQEYASVMNHRINSMANGWKANIQRIADAKFPGASATKHLQIEGGVVKNLGAVKPKDPKASMAIGDILEKPDNYILDEPTQALADFWKLLRSNAVREYEKRGMKFPAAFRFPRMVKGAHGETIGFPTVRLKKPRSYETMMQGIEAGVEYVDDPVHVMQSFIDETTRIIAANDFQAVVKAMGKTASERIPPSIKNWRTAAANALKDINYSISTVRRMAVTPRGPESNALLQSQQERSLALLDQRAPQLAERIRAMVGMPAEQRTKEATLIVKELQAMVKPARAEAVKARFAYSKALRYARGPKLGAGEAGTKHPAFTGRIFSEETARTLNELLPSRAGKFTNTTRQVAEALRTLVANLDFSAWFYQGQAVLSRRPDLWAKSVGVSIKSFLKPETATRWFAQEKHVAFLSRHPDVVQGTHEFFAGRTALEKIPKVGKAIGKVIEPFERAFETFGDAARLLMGEALEPGWVKAGAIDQLPTYINRMTAVMNTKALGISGAQRAIESSWVAFAPRFMRASLAYLGMAFEKGVVGNEARRTLAQMLAGGTTAYVGYCEALGQEPKLDISKPDRYTVMVGNRRIGIGGFMMSFLGLVGDISASVMSERGNEPMDLLNFHPIDARKTNPIIKYISSRTSILTSLVTEGAIQQDFLGYPLEDPEDWARWLIVEHSLPIAVQSQFASDFEEPPTNRIAVFASEQLGFRVYPDEPFYELADQYAQQVYGKDWSDLYKANKSGSYSKSEQQEKLIEHFPDLNKAYEEYKPKATKRWQTAHNMLPDEGAVKDYYANQLFHKKWDDLTKEEKQKAEAYRVYDEATK